jgi:eukaryotic-like serine/threonine-protein kinase
VMAPISQDPETTQALPHTQVMPTTMTPVETLPNYDEEPGNKRNYIVGAALAGLVILGGIIFLITSLGSGNSGITVPNVKGATCDVAKQQMEALKLSVSFSPAETVCDATAIVASQDPSSGDTAKEGEIITLVFPAATVEVPPLLGLTEEAARAAIEGAGFVFSKGPDVIDKTYALGQVAVQNPAGRQQLAKGMTVTVNLSGGTGQLAVPNVVIGQTTASAQTFLQGEPYKFVVTIAEEANATIAKGIVVRTDPVAGTLVDAGVPVTVYVSSGPQPVATPSVKGLAEADARAKLTAVGLGAEVEYVNLAAGDVNIGKVISQGTPAGTMIAPPTKVVLTVGRDGTIPAG